MCVKFIEKKNGTLRVRFVGNKFDKQELRSTRNKYGINQAFLNATEGYWTNGWGVLLGDTIGQMTDCFVISKGESVEDDLSRTLYGKSWTNVHNYQIVDEIEEVCTKGYYDFYPWQDFGEKGENFPNPYMVK